MLSSEMWEQINDVSLRISRLSAKDSDRKEILKLIGEIIPFEWALFVLIAHKDNGEVQFVNRVVESKYPPKKVEQMVKEFEEFEPLDYLRWVTYEKEPVYIHEKDLINDKMANASTFYNSVIKKYNACEAFNFSICANEMCLGGITLTRVDSGPFSEDEIRVLKALGPHIGTVLFKSYVEDKNAYSGKEHHSFKDKYSLTEREMEVLECVKDGMENPEISETLHIAENTVKKHVNSILNKVGVANKYRLMKVLIDEKMIAGN